MLLEAETQSNLFSPDQFAGYAVTAVITIFNVLLVFIVIRCFAYKKILKLIHDRQEALDAELEGAKKSREEAQAVVDTSKKTIDDAKRKASEIMEEACKDALADFKEELGEELEAVQRANDPKDFDFHRICKALSKAAVPCVRAAYLSTSQNK